MRELKFRAWDGEQMVSPDHIDREGRGWWRENSIPTSSTDLMQYTGLKDKNGREIYEGDILKRVDANWGYGGDYDKKHDGHLYLVVPDINVLLNEDHPDNFTIYPIDEVIGNIHENPELLEG